MIQARIALFGGTFDPVHWGHLLLAESTRAAYRLDRVVFIPTGLPPHKRPAVARPADRLRMLCLATARHSSFDVSDWEIRQKRVVYSYETIAHFRDRWPRAKLFFIVGTDMLRGIGHWKKGKELLDRCMFLGAERPGISWSRLPPDVRRKARPIQWPAVPLASHDIRARVKKGRSIRYQVPDAVERYIRKHGLYKS